MTVNRATIALLRNEEFNESLITADDLELPLNASGWADFGLAMQSHISWILFYKSTKRIEINNMTSVEDIVAMTLTL
jgi:hypothetical protein